MTDKPLYIIVREIILEKMLEKWPMDSLIINHILELCEYRTYKCQEHLQYAVDNKLNIFDVIQQNKRSKPKNCVNISVYDLITTAQMIKNKKVEK